MGKIWTVNARDTVLFDLVVENLGLSHVDLGPELRGLHAQLVDMLATKGVAYADLRAPLVPHTTTTDLALIFDIPMVGSNAYGLAIAREILPLVDRGWSGSILEGDLIHRNQDRAFDLINSSFDLVREADIADTSDLFCVYLSNLSNARVEQLVGGLASYRPFIGSLRANSSSPVKDWLSLRLVNSYVKHRDTFINMHEDDRDGALEVNMKWWPLKESGYRVVSVPASLYFDPFLSYKIERAVYSGFESDTIVGLSAVSTDPQTFDGFTVYVDPKKIGYLRGETKAGLIGAAGLADATAADIEFKIAAKVDQSYVYELEHLDEHGVTKFNVVVEFEVAGRSAPVRLVAAMAYEPALRRLRFVTFT